jgi:hypothetical protein
MWRGPTHVVSSVAEAQDVVQRLVQRCSGPSADPLSSVLGFDIEYKARFQSDEPEAPPTVVQVRPPSSASPRRRSARRRLCKHALCRWPHCLTRSCACFGLGACASLGCGSCAAAALVTSLLTHLPLVRARAAGGVQHMQQHPSTPNTLLDVCNTRSLRQRTQLALGACRSPQHARCSSSM